MDIPGVKVIDLTIEVEKKEEGALEVLKLVRPEWSSSEIKYKTFTEGISNFLFGACLKTDSKYEDMVLMRIYGNKTELIIDRDLEMLGMYILNKANCARPLLCRFNNGIAYGFMPGSCLDEKLVRDETIGRLVAQEMVHLGAIDPETYSDGIASETVGKLMPKDPVLFPKLRRYLSLAPEEFDDPEKHKKLKETIPSHEALSAEIDELESHLSVLGSPVVLCHNDILLKNIVHNKSDDRCYLIDFEYQGFNYQAYDIGNHFCEWAGMDEVDYTMYPGKEDQCRWLRNFLEVYFTQQGRDPAEIKQTDVERIYVQANKFALAAHFFWGVWALIQSRYSTIDFDYLSYAKIRLDEYFAKKEQFFALQMPA